MIQNRRQPYVTWLSEVFDVLNVSISKVSVSDKMYTEDKENISNKFNVQKMTFSLWQYHFFIHLTK